MVESLDERFEKELGLLNKSNAAMSVQIQVLSKRLAALENQGTRTVYRHCAMHPLFIHHMCHSPV